jgi:mRNA interferase RelE/StbE
MSLLRVDLPPRVAEFIRHLEPQLKHRIRAALRTLAAEPARGEPLKRDLSEYRKYRVGRLRIVYEQDTKGRVVRVMAIGQRRRIYEELAQLVKTR